jgi:hypothetical protein
MKIMWRCLSHFLSMLYDQVCFPWTWRWRRHVPTKRQLTFNGLNDILSHKTELFKAILTGNVNDFVASRTFHTAGIFSSSVLIDLLIFFQSCHFWLKIVPVNRVSLQQHVRLSVAASSYNPQRQQCVLSRDIYAPRSPSTEPMSRNSRIGSIY